MSQPVNVEAPGLTIEQMQEGVKLGLFQEFQMMEGGGGWVITVTPKEYSVPAVVSFVNNPPDVTTVDSQVRNLCDAYLDSVRRYESLPVPPSDGPDPWEKMRVIYLERMHSAQAAMEAGGGPC